MSTPRTLLLCATSLAVGFAIGYAVRTDPAPAATVSELKPSVPAVASARAPEAVASAAPDRSVAPPVHAAAGRGAPSLTERLAHARWLRSVGHGLRVEPYQGNQINPRFAQMIDLSPAASERLTAAGHAAEKEIQQLRDARATSRVSGDGETLIVELPQLDPVSSRGIYDRFRAEWSATLGADRLALADEIAGDSIDRLYDQFGLSAVRYELTLKPTFAAGTRPIFEYKRHYVDADGTFRGWGGSKMSLEGIRKEAPTLARFISVDEPTPPKR